MCEPGIHDEPQHIYQGEVTTKYPDYLRSRIGIDLRVGKRKEGYQELLRAIYEKPVTVKPEQGTRPKWLDEPTLDTKLNMFAAWKTNYM